jgi:uncharacterized iron-regulated membrane protein
MTLRKAVFWLHLIAGVVGGLIILIMSVTGVLLAYEKQVTAWADRGFIDGAGLPGSARVPVATLIAATQEANGGKMPSSLTFYSDSRAVAAATNGPTIYVDSVSGKILGSGATVEFFRSVKQWHRYLSMSGHSRATGAAITGAATLVGVFLVAAGLYLWFPYRTLWFKTGLNGKARNWNWHNVIGFWMAIPMFLILVSGVVIGYDWANNLVYTVTGTHPTPDTPKTKERFVDFARLDPLLRVAERQTADWKTVVLKLPIPNNGQVNFAIDRGNGGQPYLKASLSMDPATGSILKWDQAQDQNLGRQVRNWFRYVHTGEYYGIAGQTVAGLSSFAATMLVWTGLALAFKRASSWVKVRGFRARSPKAQPEVVTSEVDVA